MSIQFASQEYNVIDVMGVNPFILHTLLNIDNKYSKDSRWPMLVTPADDHDINISDHPVYRYRFAGTPSRAKYIGYIDELINSRGMRPKDLRNLFDKRLAVDPDDVHGQVLKGMVINAMRVRDRDEKKIGTVDNELEVYEVADQNNRFVSHKKVRAVPRWWMPECVESRRKLAELTSIVTPPVIRHVEDSFGFQIIVDSIWAPQDRSGTLVEQKRKYREQLWNMGNDGWAPNFRNMAGKMLVCESSDSWYGQILKGAIIYYVNDYISKFQKGELV